MLGLILYALLPRTADRKATAEQGHIETRPSSLQRAAATAVGVGRGSRGHKERHSALSTPDAFLATPEDQSPSLNIAGAGTDGTSKRERALATWYGLVEEASADTQGAWSNRVETVQRAFGDLDTGDRMDGIRHALNLLPDESFPMLFGILYDKRQDSAVLDAIFDDALNRSEQIKERVLEHIRGDRSHPLFAEAARIVDAATPAAP